ncbi:MAG: ABC transporter ATP-binding protein, partial [Lachnospiraceae bacterium]|nr:ABC transporter ATP-binding protein [Lachnospiraceae bacterium]
MGRIWRNLRPYWYMVIVIILLLGVQAYCDLALPQYTSDIIDVGIQNRGVEHILPERMTAEEYDMAQLFMTEEEQEKFVQLYEEQEGIYQRTAEEDALDTLDEELLTPIILTYRMANMSESDFRSALVDATGQNEQMQAVSDRLKEASLEEIGSMLQVELHIHEAADDNGQMVTYVDMRPLMKHLIENGLMSEEQISGSRGYMEDMLFTMGNGTLSAMGAAYAGDCAEAAGVDMNQVQTSYLWAEGARMFTMALLMLLASVLVGYLASKVGANVGRDLRGSVFKKVVGFSNTEMDQFSTASLITRSTNDIQQIQMVTAVLLRMLLYAPIIGIGGVYKVIQTGANMGWIIVLAVLVISAFILVLMAIAMPKFKIMQKLVDALNLVSREILTGLSVIRAFGREKKEEERFDEANRNLTRTQLFTNRVMTFMMPGMMFVMYGITVLIVWVAAHRIDGGTLQVGAMTAFITYPMQLVMSCLMLTM